MVGCAEYRRFTDFLIVGGVFEKRFSSGGCSVDEGGGGR